MYNCIFNILRKCWLELLQSVLGRSKKNREKFTDRRQDRQATCNMLSEKITLAIEDDQDYRKIIEFYFDFKRVYSMYKTIHHETSSFMNSKNRQK